LVDYPYDRNGHTHTDIPKCLYCIPYLLLYYYSIFLTRGGGDDVLLRMDGGPCVDVRTTLTGEVLYSIGKERGEERENKLTGRKR
jgi:hypothetical protein